MVEVLKREYWSKADAFLLPLTGIMKNRLYEGRSYLFWNDVGIDEYKLILVFNSDEPYLLREYLRNEIFPVLDKKGYILENYDIQDNSVFILDLSEWALDINLVLEGKYSKISEEGKKMIVKYHTYKGDNISLYIYAVIYPQMKMQVLNNKTPIEYVKDYYGITADISEIGSIYDKLTETLIINVEELDKL